MGDGQLGRYRLDELLGSGGSGQVWRAHDTLTDRTVALKVLAPALAADPSYRRRFEREARAAARLRGPHVALLHTFGELEGRLFIETGFIDGVDLEALLEWEGPRPPASAVTLIAQVATALDEAHAAGVIHRDVKPANIMVALDDIAYLIDFGTAQQDGQTPVTLSGMVVGTPAYMAPERFTGTASARSDIYSLACVLYECLTGERPFRDRNPARLMYAHVNADRPRASVVRPELPGALDAVIARGMARDPAERHSSAGEFAAAARAALTARNPDPPTLALPPLPAGPPTTPLRPATAADPPPPQPDRNARTEPLATQDVSRDPASAGSTRTREYAGGGGRAPAGATGLANSAADANRVAGVTRTVRRDTPGTTVSDERDVAPGSAVGTRAGASATATRRGRGDPGPHRRRTLVGTIVALVVVAACGGVWLSSCDTTSPSPSTTPTPATSLPASPTRVPGTSAPDTPPVAPPPVHTAEPDSEPGDDRNQPDTDRPDNDKPDKTDKHDRHDKPEKPENKPDKPD
ncbi:serine/threonine protein kinase [Nocardia otitidiscaviarum]|uniref:serine/threonine-protein kinase n=1 Tax=Nocardia otitidiscaviarum TaxID=1823 RepID=UPI001893B9C5|nr:serine/threonine-protein kinase [Nocardia otitidiscaviarum]MBF6235555.1 serine/threonine protein kinase [Nocardia otitidiscaviarum]